MTKIVTGTATINGVNYDVIGNPPSKNGVITLNLKPIEPEEEVKQYALNLETTDYDSTMMVDEVYDLTFKEAEAVAKCLEELIEIILSKSPLDLHKYPPTLLLNLIEETRELIQKRKGRNAS